MSDINVSVDEEDIIVNEDENISVDISEENISVDVNEAISVDLIEENITVDVVEENITIDVEGASIPPTWGGIGGDIINQTDLIKKFNLYIPLTQKAQPNGVATLDALGKVPLNQLASGFLIYKGTWDASSNTPTISDATGLVGDVWIVDVNGTQDLGHGNMTFIVGDFVLHNGVRYEKVANSTGVYSINGLQGIVTLQMPITSISSTNEFLNSYDSLTGSFTKARPTWANIDKTISSIADLTTKSHTSLSDIGSLTHAQIDTWINSTSNTTFLKLNQSTPQTLTASPIFNNFTSGEILYSSASKTITSSATFLYDPSTASLLLGDGYNNFTSLKCASNGVTNGNLFVNPPTGWTYWNTAGLNNAFFVMDYFHSGDNYTGINGNVITLRGNGVQNAAINNAGVAYFAGNLNIGAYSSLDKVFIKGFSNVYSSNALNIHNSDDTQIFNVTDIGTVGIGRGASGNTSIMLDVNGPIRSISSTGSAAIYMDRATNGYGASFRYYTAGILDWTIGTRGINNNNFYFYNDTLGANALTIDKTTNLVTVGNSILVNGVIQGNADIAKSVILEDGYGNIAFRGTRQNTMWLDAYDTQWFQVGNTNDFVAFTTKNGLAAARMGFCSSVHNFTNQVGSIVPTDYFEIDYNNNKILGLQSNGISKFYNDMNIYSGNFHLDNNYGILIKDASGVLADMFYLSSTNDAVFGSKHTSGSGVINSIGFYQNSATPSLYTKDGKVIIGAGTTRELLSVQSSAINSFIEMYQTTGLGTAGFQLTSNDNIWQFGNQKNYLNGALWIRNETTGLPQFIYNSTGFGIGATPTNALDVYSATGGITVRNATATAFYYPTYTDIYGTDYGFDTHDSYSIGFYAQGTGNIYFKTTSNPSPKMTILNNGTVGIGVLPTELLDVRTALPNVGDHSFLRVGEISENIKMGSLNIAGSGVISGIWFDQTTPSQFNWTFTHDANGSRVNSQTGESVYLSINNVNQVVIDNTKASFTHKVVTPQFQLSLLNTAPSSSTDTGTLGEIRITNGAIYVCVATNQWKKADISTF